jgi:hypothetical protein
MLRLPKISIRQTNQSKTSLGYPKYIKYSISGLELGVEIYNMSETNVKKKGRE